MHYNCLIVDDETDLARMTCEYFTLFDVTCSSVATSQECLMFLKQHTVDILLLDINLEQESGFLLCKSIREISGLPIIFISARQSDEDILIALNIGGDDYVKKPYSLSVLLAKVKTMIKRMCSTNEKINYSEYKNENCKLRLEEDTMRVFICGRAMQLKAKEFKLLKCLYEHKNAIVTKKELFEEVWGDAFFSDGTLNVHIRKLREKIEDNPNEPQMIKTIWGTGYMLEV